MLGLLIKGYSQNRITYISLGIEQVTKHDEPKMQFFVKIFDTGLLYAPYVLRY